MKKTIALAMTASALVALPTAAFAGPGINNYTNAGGGVTYHVRGTQAGNRAVGNNVDAATPTVTNTWEIKGEVTKDCSVFTVGGTVGNEHSIDIGQIGVNTQNQVSNDNRFEMVSPINLQIISQGAGCNFNNTVSMSKSALGLVNSATGGYDQGQFQANIPYRLNAHLTAPTSQSGPAGASGRNLTIGTADSTIERTFGAWRSRLELTVTAPQVTDRALVAGEYKDTITVTLAAL